MDKLRLRKNGWGFVEGFGVSGRLLKFLSKCQRFLCYSFSSQANQKARIEQ